MYQVMKQGLYIPCNECGQVTHAPGCLDAQMRELEKNRRHLPCPKCGKYEVDRNDADFLECRKCHVQYSTAGVADCPNPEETFIVDEREDRAIPVLVLEKKGTGQMFWDKALDELRPQLKANKKK